MLRKVVVKMIILQKELKMKCENKKNSNEYLEIGINLIEKLFVLGYCFFYLRFCLSVLFVRKVDCVLW